MFGLELGAALAVVVGIVIAVIELFVLLSLYKKCPPNQAMIVSGMYAGSALASYKVVVGGAAIVLPRVQQVSYVNLELKTSQIQSKVPMFTKDGVPLKLSFAAQYKVNADEISIATAAELMLGKIEDEVEALVSDVLLGMIRQRVAGMSAEQVRRAGLDDWLPDISRELNTKLGFVCVALSVEEYAELDAKQVLGGGATAVVPRLEAIAEYERAMPILEKEVGERSLVFKDFLLRYAELLAQDDNYLSREKADQIRVRANNVDALGAPTLSA